VNQAKTHPFSDTFPLAIVAAVARNRVIGRNNTLPWRLPEDLKRFRKLTTRHAVVMGRKTWESLPHALPERQNIVVTRNQAFRADGGETASSLIDAINMAHMPTPIFCIGGGDLYRQAMRHTAVLYLTEIDADVDGDAFFPDFERDDWMLVEHEPHTDSNAGFSFAFNTYVRKELMKNGGSQ
jgi:Dihydrofolate reductase